MSPHEISWLARMMDQTDSGDMMLWAAIAGVACAAVLIIAEQVLGKFFCGFTHLVRQYNGSYELRCTKCGDSPGRCKRR